jgi:integrase
MANIQPRRNKDGKVVSYSIRVHKGRDSATGKQLKPYTMTWKVPLNWSEKTAEKEAHKQAAIFEKQVREGLALDNRQTFAEYAEYVVGVKDRGGTKYRIRGTFERAMKRVAPDLGHLKIADIRPQHLNQLYEKMSQPGQRRDTERVLAKVDMKSVIAEKDHTIQSLHELSGVSVFRLSRLCDGHAIKVEGTKKIAEVLGVSANSIFNYRNDETPLKGRTIMEVHLFISTIMEQAVREMLIPYNPAGRATPPSVETPKRNYFQPEDIERILEALELETVKVRTLTHLLLVTGCRRGEIAGLIWDNVDWNNNQIYIDRAILYNKNAGIYEGPPKTKSSVRWIKLPEETMSLLDEYRKWQNKYKTAWGDKWVDNGHVFTKLNGGLLHPNNINNTLSIFSARHNLPHINPHAFRHTQASILFFNRVDAVSISRRLGHARVSTTSDIYSHFINQSEEIVKDCIADVILRSSKPKITDVKKGSGNSSTLVQLNG